MDFLEEITQKIKAAMKAKDKVALEALRGIKKELLEAQTAKGASDTISKEASFKIIQKMVKQRKDSAGIFADQGRPELADKELAEVTIIEQFLPAQMSQEEVEKAIKSIIAKVGAQSMKEMGKVMGVASAELGGKAEGKLIASVVKQLLGS